MVNWFYKGHFLYDEIFPNNTNHKHLQRYKAHPENIICPLYFKMTWLAFSVKRWQQHWYMTWNPFLYLIPIFESEHQMQEKKIMHRTIVLKHLFLDYRVTINFYTILDTISNTFSKNLGLFLKLKCQCSKEMEISINTSTSLLL